MMTVRKRGNGGEKRVLRKEGRDGKNKRFHISYLLPHPIDRQHIRCRLPFVPRKSSVVFVFRIVGQCVSGIVGSYLLYIEKSTPAKNRSFLW